MGNSDSTHFSSPTKWGSFWGKARLRLRTAWERKALRTAIASKLFFGDTLRCLKNLSPILLFILLVSGIVHAKTRVVFLGDSLTEGYGIEKNAAYPALVEKRLKIAGKEIEAINAGISGSTTASAKSRLQWLLKNKFEILVLALGANDGLRGIDVKVSRKHLTETVQLAKTHGLKVLLVGMKLPPNFGPAFAKDFETMFGEIAKSEQVAFLPFLLEGVGGVPSLNLNDGIHPNAKGHEIIADTVVKALQKLL